MRIEVFEDPTVCQLDPVTLSRAAYSIHCGSFALADWLQQQNHPIRGLVRPHLAAWQSSEYPRFKATAEEADWRLVVNARLVPCRSTFQSLLKMMAAPRPGLVWNGDTLLAGILPPEAPALVAPWEIGQLDSFSRHPQVHALPPLEQHLPLLSFPHDLVSKHVEKITDNLELRIQSGGYQEVRNGVFLAGNADLADWAHTDTSQGPIVIDAGAQVKPFACLRGPIYLGPLSVVNEHANGRK